MKSFCQREKIRKEYIDEKNRCLLCGELLNQIKGKKEKKYCNDVCRMKWWNNRLDRVNKKAYTTHICTHCKKEFTSYANPYRKYCSHSCYVKNRFGGNSYDK